MIYLMYNISLSFFFVKFTLPRYNSTLPCTWGKLKYILQKIKSKFTHINIYLYVKCILTFINFFYFTKVMLYEIFL